MSACCQQRVPPTALRIGIIMSARPPTRMELELERGEDVDTADLPSLPSGRSLAIRQAPVIDAGTGGKVWPAAAVMCRWLRCQQAELRGSSILELGCGAGACGIFAAALGASRVMLTDGEDAAVGLAARNAQDNRTMLGGADVRAGRLLWGGRSEVLPKGPWDFVLASDVLYRTGAWKDLAATLRNLCAAQERPPRMLLALAHRHSGPLITEAMWAQAPGMYATSLRKEERPGSSAAAPSQRGAEPELEVAVSVMEVKRRVAQ